MSKHTLLCKKIYIEFRNMYPLYLAAHQGHIECVKILLNKGANPKLFVYNEYYKSSSNAISVALFNFNFKCYKLMKKNKKK